MPSLGNTSKSGVSEPHGSSIFSFVETSTDLHSDCPGLFFDQEFINLFLSTLKVLVVISFLDVGYSDWVDLESQSASNLYFSDD